MRPWLRRVLLTTAALVVALQLVPYERGVRWERVHALQPAPVEPPWDSPGTRALAVRACFDCHSNDPAWPWYTRLAPLSWRVQREMVAARRALNFSEWNDPQPRAAQAAVMVATGAMPPRRYLLLHPDARLTAAEQAALARGLQATVGSAIR